MPLTHTCQQDTNVVETTEKNGVALHFRTGASHKITAGIATKSYEYYEIFLKEGINEKVAQEILERLVEISPYLDLKKTAHEENFREQGRDG